MMTKETKTMRCMNRDHLLAIDLLCAAQKSLLILFDELSLKCEDPSVAGECDAIIELVQNLENTIDDYYSLDNGSRL